MAKSKYKVFICSIIYAIILTGLLLPYSNGLSYGKAEFAYKSTPSNEFNYRYDTTYLGFQSFFGMYNLVLVLVVTFAKEVRKSLSTILILFIVYLISLLISNFLNSLSGIGGPYPDRFLTGRLVIVIGTIALFVFYLRESYLKEKILKIDDLE